MDWKDILKSFKIVDFQTDIKDFFKGGQIGLFNQIKIGKIELNIPEDTLDKIIKVKITAALEEAAKAKTYKILEPLSPALNMMNEQAVTSVVASTASASLIEIKAESNGKLTDDVTATVFRPSENRIIPEEDD